MSATVQIDDHLMAELMSLAEGKNEREVVEDALQELLQIRRQRGLFALRGLGWEGDLDEMRTNKPRPGWE